MRGKALVLSMTSAFALFGCENGPTQIYTPSPAGAGSVWNNGGGSNTAVDPATKGFTSTSSGSNVQDLCTGDHLAAVWANMVMQPISPPTTAGGLDISGAAWSGMTIEQAEHGFNNDGTLCDPQKVMNPAFPNYKCDHPGNCQSANDGDQFGDGTQVNQWGDNGELWADYRVSNHKIIFLTLWPGYQGTMNFHSIDNKHQYVLGIQTQITKDGQPFTLDWVGNGGKNFIAPADELYRALMATYAPALPVSPPGVTCFDTGRCIKGSFGDVAYFYIPPIGWALWIDNQNAPQPTPSIPTRLDQNLAKVMAYAYTPPLLKMDSEGPVSNATCETNSAAPGCLLGKASNPCILKMGMTYSDFLSNCVQTTGDTTADQTELNKLLGGLSHDTERFFFDVQGIDIDFTDKSLSPMDIVHDKDMPHAMDVSEEFVTDQSTLGAIANDWDYSQTPAVKDLHGTGAVYKEYARLVRANLLALAGIPDGDVSQCLYPQGYQNDPSFNAQAFQQNLPPYCTGFEGFITPALPRQKCDSKGKNCMPDPTDTTDLGPQNAVALLNGLKLGLKPGHPKALFCWDANGDLQNGYSQCTPPGGGDIFSSSFAQVQAVFGKGKLTNLPTDCQDVRFFFKQYVRAVLKYFQVASQNPVPDLSTITIDPDDLFFDSIGAGQFELSEYVDRRYASQTQAPLDIVITADVKNGIFDSYEFNRALLRGERAIYTAMTENQGDGLGAEHSAVLTNIFGSPLIAAGWMPSSKGKSAYYCGTTIDPANCDGQLPPLDANGNLLVDELGRPILSRYPGAFAGAQTAFTLGTVKMKVMQTFPSIAQALVSIPLTTDPYNPNGTALPTLQTLVPWAPKQPGIGFPIAINGEQDKFVETAQLDFSGVEITANIDYDTPIDPMTMKPMTDGTIEFLAVETTDFLGDVFLCQDPATGDILKARMYTPVATILDWLNSHAGSYDNCGMIVRFSPFNNFPDYITSLTNGVRLGITQGGGFGRVVDATLFVPGQ